MRILDVDCVSVDSRYLVKASVSDPHKKNADPDPGLHKNADPDPDPGIAKFDQNL